MKFAFRTALFSACLAFRLAATDAPAPATPPNDQKKLEAAIRLRLAEHALEKEKAAKTDPETPAPLTSTTAPVTAAVNPKDEPVTQLQRVEVSKSRITEQAIQEHQKDLEIAREKKNTVPTPLDDTLNDSRVSHALSILGGSSSEDRARVAEERVSLLEAEKDLLDEIARAPTKEERAALQKELNDLKTMRRELERAPADERK